MRRPSDVVIMENVIRQDTRGTSEPMDAKYELIDRGGYIPTGYNFDPVVLNAKLPLEFFESAQCITHRQIRRSREVCWPELRKCSSPDERSRCDCHRQTRKQEITDFHLA